MAHAAIEALRAWRKCCPDDIEIDNMLATATNVAQRQLVNRLNIRAGKHGHRAVTTAWSDAACNLRLTAEPHAIGSYSCDTILMSKPSGVFVENEPTLQSLKVSSQIPLADVALYDGESLQDYLLANGAKYLPRKATVKVKSLVVYHPSAEVSVRTRAYACVHTTSYAFKAAGGWDSVGVRCGDGVLGTCVAGQMSSFHFSVGNSADTVHCQATQPAPFGPIGACIDCARTDVIMIVTLFRKPPQSPQMHQVATYRNLVAAAITAGQDLGFPVASPEALVALGDIDGVCIEIFRCIVTEKPYVTDDAVDAMCRDNLRMQADIGGNDLDSAEKTAAGMALERLEGMAYCTDGHGPWKHGSSCPGCGALVVCR